MFSGTCAAASSSASSRSSSDALATTYVKPHVLGEIPTPQSGYESYCYGHPNQIQSLQSSRVHCGSTNLGEQNLVGMPQHYGLNNLNRHSLFRADGTEHSYFSLPADYPLERVVSEPACAVYDDKSDGCSTESVHAFTGMSDQLTNEEQHENRQASKCFSKTTFSLERPTVGTVGVFSLIDKKADNGLVAMCVNKASANGKEQQVNNEQLQRLIAQAIRKEWDPGDIVGVLRTSMLTEETSNHLTKCNSRNYLLQSAEIRYPCILSYLFIQRHKNAKCNYWLYSGLQSMGDQGESTNPLSLTTPWDPGVLSIMNMILDKYTVSHQVKFIQRTTELSFPSLTYCMQYIDPNGINHVSHATSRTMQRATHLSQDNYLSSLYFESVLKTEYYWMRCLWKFSIKLATRVQWDPGDTKLHVLFKTNVGATKLQCVDVYKSAMVQRLAMKLGAIRATIFESAIVCSDDALGLGWTENMSDFIYGQLAYMLRSPTVNSSEFLRHVFTVLSPRLSSIENRVQLQWDPGIAFVHQQGVHKNYNPKRLLLSSQTYRHIWEIGIIFITFRPP